MLISFLLLSLLCFLIDPEPGMHRSQPRPAIESRSTIPLDDD